MNVSQKFLILGVVLLLVATSVIPLVESIVSGSNTIVEGAGEGDVQPPVTTIKFGEPYYKDSEGNIYITSDTPIYLNAMDNESGINATYYKINEGNWEEYAAPFSIPEDCNHAIYFYSVDNASNEESIKNKNVSVDNCPPYPVIPPPDGNNGWYVSSVIITFADAKSDVICVWYRIDGGYWKIYVTPIIIGSDGWYTIDYYAIDTVGNEGKGSFSIKIDQTPPTTTHEFDGMLGENGWYVSNVIVTLSAEDETSGVDYTMYKLDDDIEWREYTGSFLVTEDGIHTLYYYSVDFAGNVEDIKGPFDFKIDQTPPTIEDLTAEKIGDNMWMFIADVFDETSGINRVEFYVDGEFVGEVTEAPYELVYTGTGYGLQIVVYDNAGNEGIGCPPPPPPGTLVFGIIRNPEFTEETVSFFAIVVISDRSPFYMFWQQLTFQSNYSGYIGEHFIFAVFEYGPV